MRIYCYLVFVSLATGLPNNQDCYTFIKNPGNDVNAVPGSTIPNTPNMLYASRECVKEMSCLSFSYDSERQEVSLYDNWNEDKGGEYEMETRCPRKPKHYYSKELDLCFSVEDDTKVSWQDASTWCSANGRTGLLILETLEKVNFLLRSGPLDRRWFNMLKGEIFYWVGGSYNGSNYLWDNGVELLPTSSLWHTGRPLNNNNYGYLVLDLDATERIFDEHIAAMHYFLCEYAK